MLERKTGISAFPDKLDVYRLTDSIRTVQCNLHQEAHYAYASWVITDDGVVVIDTGEPFHSSLINKEIARETDQPVKYVIYTHGHADHSRGTYAFMEHNPRIIAHENLISRFKRHELTAGYINRIMQIQIHFDLQSERMPKYPFIYPTDTYSDEYEFRLGGKTFYLFHGKGETDDHTLVWIPEEKAVFCGDLLEASFPNLGNPFKVQRYAEEWAVALERVLALDPDIAIGGDVVLITKEKILEVLGENIELLRFLQDSVVKAANEGKNLEQMTEEIQLPPHLEKSPNLQQIYSRREFAIHNIWKRYCGYFDFSPSSLLPRPKQEISGVVRGLIGDDEAIVSAAKKLRADGQLQLALETLDIILKTDYEYVPARRERMEILKKLFDTDICLMSRNTWLYYLEEDERFLDQHARN